MKACSNSILTRSPTWSLIFTRTGSFGASSGPPARSSSQLADHSIFMFLPVMSDLGRATGVCSPKGAEMSMSYSYVHGS